MAKDNEQVLFSTEEMNNMIPGSMQFQQNGPVTCLGREFPNDQARREYFREELRKKLPDLRQIEGFPIGEDDDIINLSDPPYYTACPNPWLNDFIAEWEKEKGQLEAEGKRKADFEVKEPYAYGIKQGKNSAIYNAHTYHTKVPHEVIMRYVLHYTQPGDLILDGFAGTGMTGVAATACANPTRDEKQDIEIDFQDNGFSKPRWGARHAICGDLSPICFHIASNYNRDVNTSNLSLALNSILRSLHERFDSFYEIETNQGKAHVNYFVWSKVLSCKNCGAELVVHDLSYDYKTQTLYNKLTCPNCGMVQDKNEAARVETMIYDEYINETYSQNKYVCCLANVSIKGRGRSFVKANNKVDYPEFVGYLPTNLLGDKEQWGDTWRLGSHVGFSRVHNFYHKRTQYVLSYLYNLINREQLELKDTLMFIFTSMLPKLTVMNRYMPQHGSRALVGPLANTMYVPPMGVENNPIDQFEYQAGKVLRAIANCHRGSVTQISSASNSQVEDESIDYIFTDPPFGANIMYSELNSISESWLKLRTNTKEEAISSETQHKDIGEYQELMTRCFQEYNRVLKPGKWMTVEFSNTSAAFWNSLQYSIKNAGFVIAAITDLNKERGGLHAMLGPISVKQDLAISCYKPKSFISDVEDVSSKNTLWDFVSEHLEHVAIFVKKGNRTIFVSEREPRIIYDRVISYYIQKGYRIPMDAQEFQQGLRERYVERDGMFFTPAQAAVYEDKKKQTPEFVPMGIIVSDEANGIQWLKNQLRDTPKTYQEIQPEWMQAINGIRKGDILPELKQLLEENFIEIEGGKWRLPNMQDDVDKDAMRTKSLLREFKIYVEAASKPKAKIKEARVEALRAGFKQCYIDKDFQTIVMVGDKIPQNLRDEDEVLLQFYEIALNKVG